MQENRYAQDKKINLYGYHEFVANSLTSVINGFNVGQSQTSRRILTFLYLYGKVNAGETVTEEELKQMEKMSNELISIKAVSALKKAGLTPVQDDYATSFYKSIVKKKKM